MTRDKFPERVPFRLTRMLIHAMEACGLEGNFKATAEAVMRVLRGNRDSVTALLEAFVHDPLINWRLLTAPAPPAPGGGAPGDNAAGAALTAAAAGAGAATGGAPRRARKPSTSSVTAGVERLAAADPTAASMVEVGRAFAQAIEDQQVAAGMAATGFDPNAQAPGGNADAAVQQAIARSLAVSMSVRDRPMRAPPSEASASVAGGGGDGLGGIGGGGAEVTNERAVAVIRRIQAKLAGRDFGEDDPISKLMGSGVGLTPPSASPAPHHPGATGAPGEPGGGGLTAGMPGSLAGAVPSADGSLDVTGQVVRLIAAATSHENLAQAYAGWCSFW